jgi:hypothetical protein
MSEVAPSREAIASTGRRVRLVAVAQTQRVLILLVGLTIAVQTAYFTMYGVLMGLGPVGSPIWDGLKVAAALCALASIVFCIRLAIVSGANKIIAFMVAPLMLLPIIGILLLFRANAMATKVLRDNGARVGFLGVPPGEMSRLRQYGCTGCGYDIRGLQGGVCPECGANVAPAGVADPAGNTPIA